MEKCRALRILEYSHHAWTILILASGLAGAYIALSAGAPVPGPLLAAASLAVGLAGALHVESNLRRRRRRVEKLCRACTGEPLYWPRKTAVTCRRGGLVLCYTYALDRYYAINPETPPRRVPGSPWTPTDYYCVKMLRGRLREAPGGVRIYRGRYEALGDERWFFLRGEGVIAYAGGDADPERLAGVAAGAEAENRP